MSPGPSATSATPAGTAPAGVGRYGPPLVLVAHGSRDPAAGRSTLALRAAVQAAQPGRTVLATFLDFDGPRLAATLVELGGPAVVVPLLLTRAYHGQVDVPGALAQARAQGAQGVRLAEVLGPVGAPAVDADVLAAFVRALIQRLSEAGGPAGLDGVVLAGAGSRDEAALRTVDAVADALGTVLGVPARSGYASGAGTTVTSAVSALRAGGARRIGMASYFLAPGLLYDRAAEQAREAGVDTVAPPLHDAPGIVEAVLLRATR